MDRRFYGVDWRYVDIEWSGVEGISEFCETVKGDFFASFHTGDLMVRWLGDSDGSESLVIVYLLITNVISLIIPENVYLCDVY